MSVADPDLPLAEDSIPDFLRVASAENPDWGYPRTQRTTLMAPSAEWVQSVYSCQIELNGKSFIAPNRDYPYEGLTAYQDGENWKMIDAIGLALQRQNGEYLLLESEPGEQAVRINPWRATYCYQVSGYPSGSRGADPLPIYVSYYLNSQNTTQAISGCVELFLPRSPYLEKEGLVVTLQPFIDIRHMYGGANFYDYWVRTDQDSEYRTRIHLSSFNRTLTFFCPQEEVNLFDDPELLHWRYKLGTGNRDEVFNPSNQHMYTIFTSEEKDIASFFNLRVHPDSETRVIRLYFSCGLESQPHKSSYASLQKVFIQSRMKDQKQYRQLEEIFSFPQDLPFREAILARIAGLVKFKTYVHLEDGQEDIQAPHAGAWWFKTLWYRDLFEGLLNSFGTLMAIPEERENIRKIIWLALSWQDRTTGRILNRIPEYKHLQRSYNTSDGTLLCFIVANAYIRQTRDLKFALRVLDGIERVVNSFIRSKQDCDPFCIDGAPRVDESSGLLLSVPYHSWMDTRNGQFEADGIRSGGLPNRVSRRFISDLFYSVHRKDSLGALFASPNFFLPEINAQWIVMLRGALETIDFISEQYSPSSEAPDHLQSLRSAIQPILVMAEQHFKPVFWNESRGFLYNLLYKDMAIRDTVEAEPGVVAAALLGDDVFSPAELNAIWASVQSNLLVYRKLVKYGNETAPFGIIAKNEGTNVFYHDSQYHSDVVWLRSSPYLVRLLELLGEQKIVRQILINTLDHQMTEGALFYNQELFARPVGHNPHPDPATRDNPVPVKNPIQFWSQWCDPFVSFFRGRSV